MDDILRQFGGSDKTIPYAREFLFYLLPGMALTNLCYSFNNMMRASGYPQKAMIIEAERQKKHGNRTR